MTSTIPRKVKSVNEDVGHHISPEGLAALEAELHELETEGRRRSPSGSRPRATWAT